MPYRFAWLWVLAIFPLAGLAFSREYLTKLSTAPLEYHAHGITAALWMALLAAQSWSIHAGHRAAHRTLGASSLVLFPLFMAGGAAIFIGMAERYAGGVSPFHQAFAPRLAWLDFVAVFGFAWFYYEGLRNRRDVQLHSRWLLATVIFLLPPILGRLTPILPPLSISGPQDIWKFAIGVQLANTVAAAIALWLAVRSGRHGTPFYAASVLIVVAALAFQFLGPLEAWKALFARAADVPWWALSGPAVLFGALVAWAGWTAGRGAPTRALAA